MDRITSVMGGGSWGLRTMIQQCRLGHISFHTFLPFPGFTPPAPGWGDFYNRQEPASCSEWWMLLIFLPLKRYENLNRQLMAGNLCCWLDVFWWILKRFKAHEAFGTDLSDWYMIFCGFYCDLIYLLNKLPSITLWFFETVFQNWKSPDIYWGCNWVLTFTIDQWNIL